MKEGELKGSPSFIFGSWGCSRGTIDQLAGVSYKTGVPLDHQAERHRESGTAHFFWTTELRCLRGFALL